VDGGATDRDERRTRESDFPANAEEGEAKASNGHGGRGRSEQTAKREAERG
jgi:hypothetical protein